MYDINFLEYLSTTNAKNLPVYLRDGKLYGVDALDDEQIAVLNAAIAAYDPLPNAKIAAIAKIREACRQYIYAFYSQEKQLNIGSDEAARATAPPPAVEAMYSHGDFLRMHEFKNEARVICNMACAEVAAAGSLEAVEAVMTELEYLYSLEMPE